MFAQIQYDFGYIVLLNCCRPGTLLSEFWKARGKKFQPALKQRSRFARIQRSWRMHLEGMRSEKLPQFNQRWVKGHWRLVWEVIITYTF